MPKRGRQAKACTACRQSKLRCDITKTLPAPCTRCQQHALDCRRDENFKRVPTRHKLRDFNLEIAHLKTELKNARQQSQQLSQTTSAQTLTTPPIEAPAQPACRNDLKADYLPCWIINWDMPNDMQYRSFSLGAIPVDYATVREVFELFNIHFYPHIPILDQQESITSVYTSDRVLFWTIIVVVCKCTVSYLPLFDQLIPYYEALIGTTLLEPIRTMSGLHSLLLICLWPGAAVKGTTDPSWHYSSIALSSAMQLSLHCARETSYDFEGFGRLAIKQTSLSSQILTWMTCVRINACSGLLLGLPPIQAITPQPTDVPLLYEKTEGPRGFLATIEIQRVISSFIKLSQESQTPRVMLSMWRHFEEQLNTVRREFQNSWPQDLEVQLCHAKLQLYTLALISEPEPGSGGFSSMGEPTSPETAGGSPTSFTSSTQSSYQSSSIPILLHLGYTEAGKLIYAFDRMERESRPSGENNGMPDKPSVAFYPRFFFRMLFFATVFLFGYHSTSNMEISQSERDAAYKYILVARDIFVRCLPPGPSSYAIRVLNLLDQRKPGQFTKKHFWDLKGTYFGTSICYDALDQALKA